MMFLLLFLQDRSGVPLVAYEKYQQPREVEVCLSSVFTLHRTIHISCSYWDDGFCMKGPFFLYNRKGVPSWLHWVHSSLPLPEKYSFDGCYNMFIFQAFFLISFDLLQKLVIVPVKKELGLAFKGDHEMVVEALKVLYYNTVLSCVSTLFIYSTLYPFMFDLSFLGLIVVYDLNFDVFLYIFTTSTLIYF